jgi:MFS family permease
MGTANSPLHPAGARLVANWVPPGGAALANGLINGAACAGIAATPFLFGLLIDALDWPGAFLAAGGLTLPVALLWSFTASNYPPEQTPPEKWADKAPSRPSGDQITRPPGVALPEPWVALEPLALPPAGGFLPLLRNTSLLCLTFSYGMLGYFEYLFFYWAQYYFERVLALSKATGRLYTGLLVVAMGAGMVVGGRLSDRMAARLGMRAGLAVVPVVGLLLAAAATACGAFSTIPVLILAWFAVAMAAAGLGEGSYWTAAVRIGGERGGTAAAILNTGGNAGGLLAPVVTPYISQWLGWQAGLGVAGVLCVAGAVLWWGVTPAHYRSERARNAEGHE